MIVSQLRVFEFAKQIGIETLNLMDKLREWEIPVKNHMASLDDATIELIKAKLDDEQKAKAVPVKKAKKAATKKTATTTKAAAVKKAATTKAGSSTKKVAEKRTVIRRKAEDILLAQEAEKAAAEEALLQQEAQDAAAEIEVQESQSATPSDLEATSQEKVAPTEKAKPDTKRNIIGRMDLTRVKAPERPAGSGYNRGGPRGPSTTGQSGMSSGPMSSGPSRNLRTGFMHAVDPIFEQEHEEKRKKLEEEELEKERKRKAKAEEDAALQRFSATDYRKREVVFQQKKKRVLTAKEAKKTQITTPKALKRTIKVDGTIQVAEFAKQMGVKATQIISRLMKDGVMVTLNSEIDFDTASIIAPDFNFEVQNVTQSAEDLIKEVQAKEATSDLFVRTPVVTVMGHVDHGKTSLLDAIRQADVASGEAGGITQHIGAYQVVVEGGQAITFIDTPGHAAFTAMRARGANVTDIVILVVAADDGMMPQTVEALNHAKSAGVPIIVAVNKIDKPGANPDKIKQQLSEHELLPEDWGGTTIYCQVSALKKTGIKELLEQVLLVAEVQELKANPNRPATGIVIESRVDKGRGVVATVLVKDGTLENAQYIVAGTSSGRVRSMQNDRGERLEKVGPGAPAEILGLDKAPQAGDAFDVVSSEKVSEEVVQKRLALEAKEKAAASAGKMSLETIFAKIQNADVKELPIVLKTDVAGSAEAIKGMLEKTSTDEVKIKILHTAVGGITESDVLLAQTSKGVIIGFNVRPDSGALSLSKQRGVEIKCYSIIYELVDDIKKAMGGLLAPEIRENTLGQAEVRQTFTVPKAGTIAGCIVKDGKVTRNAMARLIREGRIIYEGKLSSLKRFKDDAREVAAGYECGIGIENYNDIKVGDIIEAFEKQSIARELQ